MLWEAGVHYLLQYAQDTNKHSNFTSHVCCPTSPFSLPMADWRMASGGARTSARATASSLSCAQMGVSE